MTKSPVRVVVRTRPTQKFAQENIEVRDGSKSINVVLPRKDSVSFVNNQRENFNFKFDAVLHNSSQEAVYEECAKDIVSSVVDGYNGTILAYGQTGAGKTFTMTGATTNYKQRGLIPRIIENIYHEVHSRPEKSFSISISYLEIYNETLYDLLSANVTNIVSDGIDDRQQITDEDITILEDSSSSIFVRGLTKHAVADEEEGLSLLFEGEANRAICEHQMNKASTRSHCIFTIYLESRSRVESEGQTVLSKLNLVDLAGSERVSKTQSSGTVLKEAMYINKSLSFLEQVVIALSTPSRDHIPYRQSKLTHFLKDSLGGNCKTLMVANIWGELSQIEETVSTLKFASRMMRVSNNAVVNIQMNPEALIKKYEKQIKELKQELAMHDQLKGVSQASYDPYNEDQRYELSKTVRGYIDDEIDGIEIKNVRQIMECFSVFKTFVKDAEANRGAMNKMVKQHSMKQMNDRRQSNDHVDAVDNGDGVGEIENERGFGTGIATPSSKFTKSQTKSRLDTGNNKPAMETAIFNPNVTSTNNNAAQEERLERNEAYEKFKLEEGKENFEQLKDNMLQLKEKKRQLKETSANLNTVKKKLDECKQKLEMKKQELHGVGDDIVDHEEMIIFNEMKEIKTQYKELYEDRKMTKNEVEYMTKGVETSRMRLLNQFEEWYQERYGRDEPNSVRSPKQRRGPDDRLDDGEKFELLEEERVKREDPESFAFFRAKKKSAQQQQSRTLKMPPINRRR